MDLCGIVLPAVLFGELLRGAGELLAGFGLDDVANERLGGLVGSIVAVGRNRDPRFLCDENHDSTWM